MKSKFTETIKACLNVGMKAEDINFIINNRIALSYAINEAVNFYGENTDDLEWYIGQLKEEYQTYESPIWFKYGL